MFEYLHTWRLPIPEQNDEAVTVDIAEYICVNKSIIDHCRHIEVYRFGHGHACNLDTYVSQLVLSQVVWNSIGTL